MYFSRATHLQQNHSITRKRDLYFALISFLVMNRYIATVRSTLFVLFEKIIVEPLLGIRVVANKRQTNVSATPTIYIANHTSHLDTYALISALSFAQKRNIAIAAAEDHFFKRCATFLLISSIINIFPFSRRGICRKNSDRIQHLFDHGKSILIFPEGTRSRDGKIHSFKRGIGTIVKETGATVVPVAIDNAFELLSYRDRFPKRGTVSVTFGEPLCFENESFENESCVEIVEVCEEAVRGICSLKNRGSVEDNR